MTHPFGVFQTLQLDRNTLLQFSDPSLHMTGAPIRARKSTWTILDTFASVTSLQGVPYMKKSQRWWSTLFWVVVFVLACGACIWHMQYLGHKYWARDTSTKTSVGFNYLDFPSVTVCNMNPIRRSQLDKTSEDMQEFIGSLDQGNTPQRRSRPKVQVLQNVSWFVHSDLQIKLVLNS